MAKKKNEPEPLFDITPEELAKKRHHYFPRDNLGAGDYLNCSDYSLLIGSIAKEKGWDLDEVEWNDHNGNLYKGNHQVKTALDLYREDLEMGLTVCYVIENPDQGPGYANIPYGIALVVLQSEDDSMDNYHCHRYFNIGENTWTHSYDAQQVDIETVWKWLKDPKAMIVVNG